MSKPAWQFQNSVECNVPRPFAWSYWTNVANWDDPPASFNLDGPFEVGSRLTTTLPGLTLHSLIREVVKEFQSDEAIIDMQLPGAILSFRWTFESLSEDRTRIRQRLALSGANAEALVAQASSLEKTVPEGMKNLAAAIERRLKNSVRVAHSDFSLKALYDALDEQRRSRNMSWAAVRREVNRVKRDRHPVSASTITSLQHKAVAEGDGVLQLLLWLRRTPESFVPGFPDANADRFQLRDLGTTQVLRWDVAALHAALNAQRDSRGMTWKQVAEELGRGFTANTLTQMSKGKRTAFPGVMRIVRWLGQPAADFTRASYR